MENKEILFENSIVHDKATMKEAYGYEFFGKPLTIALYALIAFVVFSQIGFSV